MDETKQEQQPTTQDPTTGAGPETAAESKPVKAKAKRRVSILVAGRWTEFRTTGEPGPNPVIDLMVFRPALTQPAGKAATKVKQYEQWLQKPETVKAFLDEGFETVETIRKELCGARFKKTEIVKASLL